jgi:hypothetical protein
MIGTVGGTALGTFILGLGYDLSGNYNRALFGLLVLPILLIIASFIVRRPPARTLTSSGVHSPVQSSIEAGGGR